MFNLPQSSKSGAKKNSKIFIEATKTIWVIAAKRDLNLSDTHIAIRISESPIKTVSGFA